MSRVTIKSSKRKCWRATARYNNTVSLLRHILGVAVESGVLYTNPADDLERVAVKGKTRECQKAIDRAAKNVKMTRITHHDLRHFRQPSTPALMLCIGRSVEPSPWKILVWRLPMKASTSEREFAPPKSAK